VGFRFGDFVLDSATRVLARKGKAVAISPKPLRLLELLLERRPNAVAKKDLQDLLWPGIFVAEGNLARLMTEVREAIGESAAKPRWIRTVHRHGYAFSGEAEAAPAGTSTARGTSFRLVWADREIALVEGINVLGRDEDSVAWIDVHSVSRRHARIVIRGPKATLEDLGSKNGTFHRGVRVHAPIALADGDAIRIGTVPLTFRRFAPGQSTKTTRVE